MSRTRTIKKPSKTGSLSLEDARATALAIGYVKGSKRAGKRRKPNAAFMKAMTPSGPLIAVVGSHAMPRSEVTKKIWGYIKRNGLIDKKKSGRVVHADNKLKPVFGGKSNVSMFEMTKLVSKHLK